MTIPVGVARVTLGGALQGFTEEFVTGFWIGGAVPETNGEVAALATAVRNSWEATLGSVCRAQLTTDCAYTQVKVYSYPSGGPTAEVVGEAPIVSGAGTGAVGSALPLQTCMVSTLHTGFAGKRRRGRMYWPLMTGGIPNHQFSQAQCTALANGLKAFFDAINAMAPLARVQVVSQVGDGEANPVTTVSVDSLPDMQLRRAASAPELFQASATLV